MRVAMGVRDNELPLRLAVKQLLPVRLCNLYLVGGDVVAVDTGVVKAASCF